MLIFLLIWKLKLMCFLWVFKWLVVWMLFIKFFLIWIDLKLIGSCYLILFNCLWISLMYGNWLIVVYILCWYWELFMFLVVWLMYWCVFMIGEWIVKMILFFWLDLVVVVWLNFLMDVFCVWVEEDWEGVVWMNFFIVVLWILEGSG